MGVIEIAKKTGFSLGTVSNVINHKKTVSPEIVEKVRHAMKEMNYTPPVPYKRRGPKNSIKNHIHRVILIRWAGDSFCLSVARGITSFLTEKHVNYHIEDAGTRNKHILNAIAHPGEGVDGLILIPHEDPQYRQAVTEAIDSGVEVVFVDRVLPGIETSFVSIDHFAGGYQATQHLLETHHCPVFYVGTGPDTSSCAERMAGWKEAMSEYDFWDFEKYQFLFPDKSAPLIFRQSKIMEWGCEMAMSLFHKYRQDKYCIFAVNDYAARGVYKAAHKIGLRVGKEVFIVGFDDTPLCQKLKVPLSSMKQNGELIGYEAAAILYDHLLGKLKRPTNRLLPTELCIRASSIGENADSKMSEDK